MKSLRKQICYHNLVFQVSKNVYEPAEDTFLIADKILVNENDEVLDIGTGCGILAILIAQKAKKVVAIDINPHAVLCTQKNTEINKLTQKIDVREGDLFGPVRENEKFNLIVSNPPYLPSDPNEAKSWISRSWAGGPNGRQLIDRFLAEAKRYLKRNGRILLVQSSLSNIDETLRRFLMQGLNAHIIAEKHVSFEKIVVICAR